jgi:hypothetical protein
MKIRLWKLGNIDHKIYATDTAFERLGDILKTAGENLVEELDIIWGPAITVQEIELDQDDINVVLGATPEGYKAEIVFKQDNVE